MVSSGAGIRARRLHPDGNGRPPPPETLSTECSSITDIRPPACLDYSTSSTDPFLSNGRCVNQGLAARSYGSYSIPRCNSHLGPRSFREYSVMSTATAPIRFRCFRCQKLLGVSKSKAGAVVACPQCSAELIVPDLEDATPPPASPSFPPPSSQSSSGSRIEPVVVLWDVPPDSDEPSLDSNDKFPALQIEPVSVKGTKSERTRSARSSVSTESPVAPAPDFSAIGKAPPVEERPEPMDVAAINIPAPSIRELTPAKSALPVSARGPRRDDVIVPRTAMILWSFVVLLALVFAFAAGLLAGRFVWARGLTSPPAVGRSVSRNSSSNPLNPIAYSHEGKYKRATASRMTQSFSNFQLSISENTPLAGSFREPLRPLNRSDFPLS